MEQAQNLWASEKHWGARPTGNTSVGDAECELKLRAAEIKHIYRVTLQRRVFRFYLPHCIASVCSFP